MGFEGTKLAFIVAAQTPQDGLPNRFVQAIGHFVQSLSDRSERLLNPETPRVRLRRPKVSPPSQGGGAEGDAGGRKG